MWKNMWEDYMWEYPYIQEYPGTLKTFYRKEPISKKKKTENKNITVNININMNVVVNVLEVDKNET